MTNEEIITRLDEILADLADERAEYRQTTVGYVNKNWKPPPPKGSRWSNAELSHDAATIKLEELKKALAGTPPPPPVTGRMFSRVAMVTDNAAAHADRYGFVVVGVANIGRPLPEVFHDLMLAGTKGLLYKNGLQIGYGSNTLPGSDPRVPYAVSKTEGSQWAAGPAWNQGLMADIGDIGFQTKWATNAIAAAHAVGAAGVFIDDLHWKDVPLPAGWTNSTVEAKTLSFIKAVSPRLHDADLLVAGNIGSPCANAFINTLPSWYAPMDGWMDEGVGRNNVSHSGTLDGKAWIDNRIRAIHESEAAGKLFLGSIPADTGDTKTIRWGLAIYLLSASDRRLSTIGLASTLDNNGTHFGVEQWTADCDQVSALGLPIGAAVEASGVFTRLFEHGSVRLDSTTGTATITVG